MLTTLGALAMNDPRIEYDAHQGAPAWPGAADDAAEFLFLQRLAHQGKAVLLRDGCWQSPGFNKTSAYGTPGTAKFGAVAPQVPAMVAHIAALPYPPPGARLTCAMAPAAPVGAEPAIVYLDPPYQGTTGYGPGAACSRDEVVALALDAAEQGHGVIVSEACPVTELVERGWATRQLAGPATHNAPFRSKHEEWLTYRHPTWSTP